MLQHTHVDQQAIHNTLHRLHHPTHMDACKVPNHSLGDGETCCCEEDTVRPGVAAIVAILELCMLMPAGVLWSAPWLLES